MIVFPVFYFSGYPIVGLAAIALVFVSIPVAFVMNKVSNSVFGGVSGDMIGATNEVARAVALVLFAVVLVVLTMKVPALVMAGGKGSRMGLPTEKPLLPFLGKPLIDWVAEAILDAKKVSEFYVITSANTPQTEQHCQSKGWKVLHTDAKGYHNDLKQAVSMARSDWSSAHDAFRCSSHNRTGP